ncbi:unnamed protein product [Staurois parvus]|uniref:Uncharacterized protein n=1 Tax=Staurois parvus TaxID=386267 RepID=A0ABN9CSE7_9NEOB|nr:unnamed protein product [Staurois parvus]
MGPPTDPGPSGSNRGPCVLAQTQKKAYEKGTSGISWGPLLTPGPRAVSKFPNGQSTPAPNNKYTCCYLVEAR